MAFFLPYGPFLRGRFLSLCGEMIDRGFRPTLKWRDYPEEFNAVMPGWAEGMFRPEVQARICDRLLTMKRLPTWTGRTRPDWSLP
jgi:hypothetical protein